MRLTMAVLTLCAVLGTGGTSFVSATGDEAPPAETAALRHYLFLDCGVGEEGEALTEVLSHGEALLPELERLLLAGPTPRLSEEVATAIEREWERRESFLATNPRLGLDPDARSIVETTTRTEYLDAGLGRFELQCREKAVDALAAIGSPEALRALRGALWAADDGVRDRILAALKRSRPVGREEPRLRSRDRIPGDRPRVPRP